MNEQIFIIVDGERRELDVRAGAITLTLNNPLLAGMDKIKYSHSYTINLPMTERNAAALDLFGELGHVSAAYGVAYRAEYWVGGLPMMTDARLYVTGINGENYTATLASAMSEGLQRIKDSGVTLRDIWTDASDNDMWTIWGAEQYTAARPFFNNQANVLLPIYNAGVTCWNEEEGDWMLAKLDEDTPYFPLLPTPCVPVVSILERLRTLYGVDWSSDYVAYNGDLTGDYDLDRDGRDDVLTFGVVPLVSTAVSKERGKMKWANKYSNCIVSGHQQAEIVYFEFSDIIKGGADVGYGGNVEIEVKDLYLLADPQDIVKVRLITMFEGESHITVRTIAELSPQYYTDSGVVYDQTVVVSGWVERGREELMIAVTRRSQLINIPVPKKCVVTEFAYFDNGIVGHPIYCPDLLPDIKVWDFLRTITAMYRSVPSETGKLLRYEVARRNIADGVAANWSGKMVGEPRTMPYEQYGMSVDGLAQTNYYLMGNESADKSEGGGYRVTKCHFDSANPWLQKSAEQLKSVCFPAYDKDEKYPFADTGHTTQYYKRTDTEGIVELGEVKPAVGRVNNEYNQNGTQRLGYLPFDFPADHWDNTLGKWLARPEVVECKMLLTLSDIQTAREWTMPVWVEELRGVYLVVSMEYKAGEPSKVKLLKVK